MPVFVHLTDRRIAAKLRRNGIRMSRASGVRPAGVYCMPMVPDTAAALQWSRELMRFRHRRTLVQVRFRLDDEEAVWVGHFALTKHMMTAAQAVAWFLQQDRRAHEVIVPRRIEPKEIVALAAAPTVLGWRYWSGANGSPPSVFKGSFGRQRILARERRQCRRSYVRGLQEARARGDADAAQYYQELLLIHDDPSAFDTEGTLLPARKADLGRY